VGFVRRVAHARRGRYMVVTWSLHVCYAFARCRNCPCFPLDFFCLPMYCIYYILFVPNVLYILYIVCSECIVYIIYCLFPMYCIYYRLFVPNRCCRSLYICQKTIYMVYTYDTLMHPCRSATLPCLSSLPPLYICHDARAPPCAMHSMPVLLPALMPASLSPRLPAPSLSPLLPACLPNLSSLRLPSCPPSSRSLVWSDIKFHPI